MVELLNKIPKKCQIGTIFQMLFHRFGRGRVFWRFRVSECRVGKEQCSGLEQCSSSLYF
jgi:hypothetical protein